MLPFLFQVKNYSSMAQVRKRVDNVEKSDEDKRSGSTRPPPIQILSIHPVS
jgi:hypothetical protein